MLNMNLSALIAALDDTSRDALESAAGACVSRGGHEITVEDYVEKLLDTQELRDIITQFELSADRLRTLLSKRPPDRSTTQGNPVFSPLLVEFIQEAYLLSRLELGREQIDVFTLVLTLLTNPLRYSAMNFYKELGTIPADALKRLMIGAGSKLSPQQAASSSGTENNLQKYCTDFTDEARKGNIDPVFARGPQIRQMIDILTRRRKNNPILVGDPGVGKTAVVEGLALKIVQGDVPAVLHGTRLVGLDMGRLQAGASVKGEFEKRLKGVIDEVKMAAVPTILFIDEAHTLVGSGNAAGSGDGANLLKPALARGEVRTVAATTWSEYKKYFEKDAALARRFQCVSLDQPTMEETITILRGLIPNYEKAHHVYIRDDAVRCIAELSTRYISGRQQPDKAVDVLDTACARVKVSLGARPARLDELDDAHTALQREVAAIERDSLQGVVSGSSAEITSRHASLQGQMAVLRREIEEITTRWQAEKQFVDTILALRAQSGESPVDSTGSTSADEAPSGGAAALAELTAQLHDHHIIFKITV